MNGINRTLLVASVCCLSSIAVTFGQAVSGTITGYVYDSSDAPVAQARVTIANTGTGTTTVRETDTTGRYIVTNLLPGTYSVGVEAAGFRRFVQENTLAEAGRWRR